MLSCWGSLDGLCVAVGVEFGVDAWSGRGGLGVGLLLMLSTENEFERSIQWCCDEEG